MGNPSSATADTRNKNNFLMEKKFFSLSYNNSKGTANWVSWRLVKEDLGGVPRGQFYPDMDLPRGFVRITPRDYTGGGFDRGHMCPHNDRSATEEMSQATFVMTNMVPQSPNLNQRAWSQLEIYCRGLVERQGKRLYIVAGPAGKGGVGREGPRETIGSQHRVTVPSSCWKIIMVLNAGSGDDLERVDGGTRLIAVIMPNDMSVGNRWAGYRVPVKAVEQLTGYKFFDKVRESIIEPLKERTDKEHIPASRSPRRRERIKLNVD
jgi:endonuclease G